MVVDTMGATNRATANFLTNLTARTEHHSLAFHFPFSQHGSDQAIDLIPAFVTGGIGTWNHSLREIPPPEARFPQFSRLGVFGATQFPPLDECVGQIGKCHFKGADTVVEGVGAVLFTHVALVSSVLCLLYGTTHRLPYRAVAAIRHDLDAYGCRQEGPVLSPRGPGSAHSSNPPIRRCGILPLRTDT